MTGVHAISFIERKRKAHKKREKQEKEFWTEADPNIDAWMLVVGQQRDVFDLNTLVNEYPDIHKYIERVRRMVNVQVLPGSCPVYQAIAKLRNDSESQTEAETEKQESDVDSQCLPRRPQLSSQTYWTKIKGW